MSASDRAAVDERLAVALAHALVAEMRREDAEHGAPVEGERESSRQQRSGDSELDAELSAT